MVKPSSLGEDCCGKEEAGREALFLAATIDSAFFTASAQVLPSWAAEALLEFTG